MKNDVQITVNVARVENNGTGMYAYSRQVLECLTSNFYRVGAVAPKNFQIEVSGPVRTVPNWVAMTQGISKVRPILWLLYSHICLARIEDRVLSTTHHSLPRVKRQIISILDVRPYFYPDSHLQRWYFRRVLPKVCKSVAGVLTISQESKREIVEIYRISPDKVHVVPLFVDTSKFRPQPKLSSCPAAPFLLIVGATWKHKNAAEVLENHKIWSSKYRLKILCGNSSYRDELKRITIQLGLEEKVDFVNYVSQDDLISLFQNAAALVYPSIIEGFGIPPIEAMACGTPVIVSAIPVFREIYGDVPIYVQLGNPRSWEAAFDALQNSETVTAKTAIGVQKAREYSRERMCSALMDALFNVWPELKQNHLRSAKERDRPESQSARRDEGKIIK